MKNFLFKIITGPLSFIFCNSLLFSQQYVWVQKADFPGTARCATVFFTIGNKGYMGTGFENILKKDFWEYDPVLDSWTQKADLTGPQRFNAAHFSIGNKGYVGLGSSTYPFYTWVTDFWEYNPASNTWVQKGNFPGNGRYTTISFSIGNKGYMGTGWDQSTPYYKDFWEYDPASDIWTQKSDFAGIQRQSTAFFVIGNKGYAGFGATGSSIYNDLWEYNPVNDLWTQMANLPGSIRNNACAFSIGNYGFVGLGSITYPVLSFLNDFWKYDPSVNSWTQITSFGGTARYAVASFSIGCNAYVGTGRDASGFTNDFWELTILATASFTYLIDTCSGQVLFNNLSVNGTSFYWDFGDGTTSTALNPVHTYAVPGIYNVMLIVNESECEPDTSFQLLNLEQNSLFISIPNVLTPNGDGKNDEFKIKGTNVCENYLLKIYNRWGQLIFETDNIQLSWNGTHKGKEVPQGVYFYVLTGSKINRPGVVSLIR